MGVGLADPILRAPGASNRLFLSQSIIYNRSCSRISKPLLTPTDDTEEMFARRDERVQVALERITKCQNYCKSTIRSVYNVDQSVPDSILISGDSNLHNPIARWDTNFQTGAKTALLLPFSPIVVAADDGECIRVWNYEEAALLNIGSSSLAICLISANVYKTYILWLQYGSGGISSTMVWDLNREQLLSSIPLASDSRISALAASQVHGGQYAAGFRDGSVRLFDIRAPEGRVEKVVGIGFQPGLYPAKIVSASQAGDIQCLDIRNPSEANLTIDAHCGSLTALAIQRHTPLIASSSAKQLIKVFNTEGERLGTIRYTPNFMAQKVGSATSLAFHPYQILLAAGSTDARVSIYNRFV
ncbi:hypothetical protein L1987_21688 [Smallanthus sonchifolius]|uniref:Uncharacterized protein n=1 Tax=Smallanthus sonchifolius TaxID=185202 RepID=A0ACB9IDB3_9ASTR|nr:hypothetical protein L1987_21688 [Smallanthus sonchifolius]